MQTTFWQNYRSSILILGGLVVGGLLGYFVPEAVPYTQPVGRIFLNLIFCLVVPLIFFSIVYAIYNLCLQKKAGSILSRSVIVFAILALLTGLIAAMVCHFVMPITEPMSLPMNEATNTINPADLVVDLVSVSECYLLLDKGHLLPLLVMAILTGLACGRAPEKAKPFTEFVDSSYAVVMQIFEIVMKVAPLGLGCFFCGVVATIGGCLISGYLRALGVYLMISMTSLLIINPLIVLIRCGREGFHRYMISAAKPIMTALATCSSSACIPVSIQASRESGVDNTVASTVIPLGTNIFKLGSIPEGVIKVIMALFIAGMPLTGIQVFWVILLVGIFSSIIIPAVPVGGMSSEAVICAILGVHPAIVGILVIFATIIDLPSTMCNTMGNYTAATLVDNHFKRTKTNTSI